MALAVYESLLKAARYMRLKGAKDVPHEPGERKAEDHKD
jgi:hypothetical protein